MSDTTDDMECWMASMPDEDDEMICFDGEPCDQEQRNCNTCIHLRGNA